MSTPLRIVEITDLADRLTCAGDIQGVVALLNAHVISMNALVPVWSSWKGCVVRGVLRSYLSGAGPCPDAVLGALMQFRSPKGDTFCFCCKTEGRRTRAWYELRWTDALNDAVALDSEETTALQGFAKAWIAERNRWSALRAAWVAACHSLRILKV